MVSLGLTQFMWCRFWFLSSFQLVSSLGALPLLKGSKLYGRRLGTRKPIVVQTCRQDKRPEWTKKMVFKESGNFYFSGGFLDGSDYSVTIRCANTEALKVAAQSISQFIRAEFSSYSQGSNTGASGVERFVEDSAAYIFHRDALALRHEKSGDRVPLYIFMDDYFFWFPPGLGTPPFPFFYLLLSFEGK